jgi:outer membrane protein assembly factor BamD
MKTNILASLLICTFSIGLISCASNKPDENFDLEEKFNRGLEYMDKKKYTRAQREFSQIVIAGSHTDLGDDALFYLGESHYLKKEYILATAEFERLVQRMKYSPFVEKARWRICQSFVNESPKYYHDQTYSIKALERLQQFIDEFPESEFVGEATNTIAELRTKLGQKAYETGVLYMKLRVYDSAIIGFEDMLAQYYDTKYADDAIVGVIQSYLMLNEFDKAKDFHKQNEDRIHSNALKQKIYTLFNNYDIEKN